MKRKATKATPPPPLRLEWREAAELADNPSNWWTHPAAQVEALDAVLKEVGWAGALLYNEATGRLIDGHARKKLSKGKVPVLVGSWTEEQERKILATLDPLAAMAEASKDKLEALLASVKSDSPAVKAMLEQLAAANGIAQANGQVPEDPGPQIDRAGELQKKWGTERGQLWQIGRHRLLCGDSTNAADVERLMGGEKADMAFTDPPYGHNNNNNGDLMQRREEALGRPKTASSAPRPIANDGPEANEVVRKVFSTIAGLLKPGCCCCCCGGGGGPDPQFARWSLWLDEVIPFKMCVVWDKGGLGMGWHYRRNWECTLIAEKPGAACKWYGGHDVPNVIRDIGKIIPSADQHPTEKPVALPEFFMRLHSEENDVIFEPFAGSGTTLVAAEQLGRRCFGMEIEPKYVAVTLERLSGMGLKPEQVP